MWKVGQKQPFCRMSAILKFDFKKKKKRNIKNETTPDKFVFFSKLVRQKGNRVSKIQECMWVRYVLKEIL